MQGGHYRPRSQESQYSRGSDSTQASRPSHYGGRGFRGGGRGGDRGRGGGDRGRSRGGPGGGGYATQAVLPPHSKYALVTNHFPMQISDQGNAIHLYSIEIVPEVDKTNARLVRTLLRPHQKQLQTIFKAYITSGFMMFSNTHVKEEVDLESEAEGEEYAISFQYSGSFNFKLGHNSLVNREAFIFVNILMKRLLRESNMKQLGRLPRFYKPDLAKHIEMYNLEMWPGYLTSVKLSESRTLLLIENVNKFFQRRNTLQVMSELKSQNRSMEEIKDYILENNPQVITTYGANQIYHINDIIFDSSPRKFHIDDLNCSIEEYFQKKYGITIKSPHQPLFQVNKRRGGYIYLVPELTRPTGLPPEVRMDRNSARELSKFKVTDPTDRLYNLMGFIKELSGNEKVKDFLDMWGIEIKFEPIEVEGEILSQVQHLDGRGVDLSSLRKAALDEPVRLAQGRWLFFYFDKHFNLANEVFQTMRRASGQLKIRVQEPQWVEVPMHLGPKEMVTAIEQSVDPKQHQIAFVLIDRATDYFKFKRAFAAADIERPLVSQFCTFNVARKKDLSVASNLLKQMNAKMQGDLYRLRTPKQIPRNTMVVGIDVSHESRDAIVGFCATIDPHFAKYYSRIFKQKKQQEIVLDHLDQALKGALKAYSQYNKGELPELIIIYRDGVSDTMRSQVLKHELKPMRQMVSNYAPSYDPKMTVVVVNKRINQRFFQRLGGRCVNPAAGTLIEHTVVQSASQVVDMDEEVKSKEFDFFMIPQKVNVGSALATHYYVASDDSGVPKRAFINFTHTLCYLYFNWPGPIKVPAPVMNAHKLALFMHQIKAMPYQGPQLNTRPYYL